MVFTASALCISIFAEAWADGTELLRRERERQEELQRQLNMGKEADEFLALQRKLEHVTDDELEWFKTKADATVRRRPAGAGVLEEEDEDEGEESEPDEWENVEKSVMASLSARKAAFLAHGVRGFFQPHRPERETEGSIENALSRYDDAVGPEASEALFPAASETSSTTDGLQSVPEYPARGAGQAGRGLASKADRDTPLRKSTIGRSSKRRGYMPQMSESQSTVGEEQYQSQESIADSMSVAFGGAGSAVAEGAQALASNVMNFADDVKGETMNVLHNTAGKIGEFTGGVGDKLGDLTGGAGEKLGDLTGRAGEKLGDFTGGVGDTLGNFTGDLRDNTGDVFKGVVTNVSGTTAGIGAGIGNLFSEGFNSPRKSKREAADAARVAGHDAGGGGPSSPR